MSPSSQQSSSELRFEPRADERALPFEFEDRTDPLVEREEKDRDILRRWVASQRARGLRPS